MNYTTIFRSRPMHVLAVAIAIVLAIIWTLGMSGVIHLPLALVWVLPFTCLIIGASVIMWDSGAFDS